MITNANIMVENWHTHGFAASLTAPMSIKFESGEIHFADWPESHSYPSIEFDMVADTEITVYYDVYLLRANNSQGYNVHVDRTEFGVENMPMVYEGDAELLHHLCSISIPPKTTDASTLNIEVRNVIKKEAAQHEV